MLRALGVAGVVATAGCLFDGGETGENGSETSRRTDTGANRSEEPTAGGEVTATHEQSIVTGTPAATTSVTTSGENRTTTPTATSGSPSTDGNRSPTRTDDGTVTNESTGSATATTTAAGEQPGDEWRERTPLPVVGSDAGGGVLDGKLHFFGGIETDTGLAAVARTFAYDPTTGSGGSWERLPDLPRALWGSCGVATGTKLFSFGGAPTDSPYMGEEPPTDAVFRYRPGDGWTDLTETQGVRCPYANWVMGGVYNPDDGLIYCLGGGTGETGTESATDHGAGDLPGAYDESRLWTFDPRSETVADPDLARMPEAKRWPTAARFDVDGQTYIHAIGGLLGTAGPTDTNYRYDIDAGEWEEMASTPRAGTYATHGNPVIDGRAYLTHGMFWEGEPTTDRYETVAHRYDPRNDAFETGLAEPTHRRGGATSGVIDGTLYVAGGHIKRFEQDGLHDCVAHNEAYTPADG